MHAPSARNERPAVAAAALPSAAVAWDSELQFELEGIEEPVVKAPEPAPYHDIGSLLSASSADAKEILSSVQQFRELSYATSTTFDAQSVAQDLADRGYSVVLRAARPPRATPNDATTALRNLRNTFAVVRSAHGSELLVELSLRQHFELPSARPAYHALVASLPATFVGPRAQLLAAVQLLAAALASEYQAQGMTVPPWRSAHALASRWAPQVFSDERLSRSQLTTPAPEPAFAAVPVAGDAARQQELLQAVATLAVSGSSSARSSDSGSSSSLPGSPASWASSASASAASAASSGSAAAQQAQRATSSASELALPAAPVAVAASPFQPRTVVVGFELPSKAVAAAAPAKPQQPATPVPATTTAAPQPQRAPAPKAAPAAPADLDDDVHVYDSPRRAAAVAAAVAAAAAASGRSLQKQQVLASLVSGRPPARSSYNGASASQNEGSAAARLRRRFLSPAARLVQAVKGPLSAAGKGTAAGDGSRLSSGGGATAAAGGAAVKLRSHPLGFDPAAAAASLVLGYGCKVDALLPKVYTVRRSGSGAPLPARA